MSTKALMPAVSTADMFAAAEAPPIAETQESLSIRTPGGIGYDVFNFFK
jgi:hypothetical protein